MTDHELPTIVPTFSMLWFLLCESVCFSFFLSVKKKGYMAFIGIERVGSAIISIVEYPYSPGMLA